MNEYLMMYGTPVLISSESEKAEPYSNYRTNDFKKHKKIKPIQILALAGIDRASYLTRRANSVKSNLSTLDLSDNESLSQSDSDTDSVKTYCCARCLVIGFSKCKFENLVRRSEEIYIEGFEHAKLQFLLDEMKDSAERIEEERKKVFEYSNRRRVYQYEDEYYDEFSLDQRALSPEFEKMRKELDNVTCLDTTKLKKALKIANEKRFFWTKLPNKQLLEKARREIVWTQRKFVFGYSKLKCPKTLMMMLRLLLNYSELTKDKFDADERKMLETLSDYSRAQYLELRTSANDREIELLR
jgi:hypothetical protein